VRIYASRIFSFIDQSRNVKGKVNRMARPVKEAAVAELTEDFKSAMQPT
jgi:hypothetical protein